MWLKLDDQVMDHPKIEEAVSKGGAEAFYLWVAGLARAGRYLTNGALPAGISTRLLAGVPRLDAAAPERLAKILVDVGLWEAKPDGSFMVHDFLDYNPDATRVKAKRAAATERQARRRKRGPQEDGGQPERERPIRGVGVRGPEVMTLIRSFVTPVVAVSVTALQAVGVTALHHRYPSPFPSPSARYIRTSVVTPPARAHERPRQPRPTLRTGPAQFADDDRQETP